MAHLQWREGESRIIVGSGRSGTTWVQDVIAKSNNLRTIFEPLKVVSKKIPDWEYACLQPGTKAEDLRNFLELVFSGKFNSIWTDFRTVPASLYPTPHNIQSIAHVKHLLWIYKKFYTRIVEFNHQRSHENMLVKFIRANLMLEWIFENFLVRALFITRHPGAVIESQLRQDGEFWDPYLRLNYYTQSVEFTAAFGQKYQTILNRNLSPAQANALIWCIENQYPMELAGRPDLKVITYESLVGKPETYWAEAIDFLCLKNRPTAELLGQPSQQSWDKQAKIESLGGNKPKWMKRLSAQEMKDIQGILDECKVTLYTMDSAFPNENALQPPPPSYLGGRLIDQGHTPQPSATT